MNLILEFKTLVFIAYLNTKSLTFIPFLQFENKNKNIELACVKTTTKFQIRFYVKASDCLISLAIEKITR